MTGFLKPLQRLKNKELICTECCLIMTRMETVINYFIFLQFFQFIFLLFKIFNKSGYVSPDELRIAFSKIQVKLTPDDFESMFRYFNISNMSKISVKDFAQNFAGSALK